MLSPDSHKTKAKLQEAAEIKGIGRCDDETADGRVGTGLCIGEILVLLIGQTAILLFGVFFAVMILISACAGRIQKGVGAYKKNMRTTLLFCMLPVFMLFGGVRLCSAQQKSEAMWEAGTFSVPVTFYVL